MKLKHVVLAAVVAACAAGAYFWVTDSWPGRDAGVKNPDTRATPSVTQPAAPSPSARQPAPTPAAEAAAAPGSTPTPRADDGLPLFNERESLRVKLEELEKNVKDIPGQRDKAKAEPGEGTETKKFKQLLVDSAAAGTKVKEEFADFDKKFAEAVKPREAAPSKERPPLTGENVTLASTIADNVQFWALPLLALLSLLFLLTLAQLWRLRSQAQKLDKANHELVINIQQLNKSGVEGQELLLKEVKAVAEDQLPSIDTLVSDTKALADSLRNSVNQVLERLELLQIQRAGQEGSSDYNQQSSGQPTGQRDGSRSQEVAKLHSFPVAVADYLNLVKDTSSHVKTDQFNDVLVEASEAEGEFVLVKDPPTETIGISYIIPETGYFRTKQDFLNGYYPKYYECPSQPPVGTVRIISPAKVEKTGGGWRLAGERGVLEVHP